MKKLMCILIGLTVLTAVCFGIDAVYTYNVDAVKVNPGEVQTIRNTWTAINTTASTGTAPTALGTDELTYITIQAAITTGSSGDGKISIYSIPRSFNAARFRCIGISDNNDVVYQVYFGTLGIGGTNCNYAKAAQLAFEIGAQQTSTSGYEFADTVTVTEYCWVKSWGSKTPGSDLVAEAAVDLTGADSIVVVPETVDCNAILLIKGF